jgi:pilus assembly protein Flp/PilA
MLATRIRSFLADESGTTAIEYALIGTLIAMVIITSVVVLGDGLKGLFNNGSAELIAGQSAKI